MKEQKTNARNFFNVNKTQMLLEITTYITASSLFYSEYNMSNATCTCNNYLLALLEGRFSY